MDDVTKEQTLLTEIRELKQRIAAIERTPRYTATAIPHVVTGTVNDFGFVGRDSTSFGDVIRSDVYATAPVLDFEIQTATDWGSGITTVDWQIEVTDYATLDTAIVASSTDVTDFAVYDLGGGYIQTIGQVNIFDALIGEETFNRFIRIDLEIKRTGGSGEAAIRLIKPMLLRVNNLYIV